MQVGSDAAIIRASSANSGASASTFGTKPGSREPAVGALSRFWGALLGPAQCGSDGG